MEVGLIIPYDTTGGTITAYGTYQPKKTVDALKTEDLPNQEKLDSEEEINAPSDTVILSIRAQNIALYSVKTDRIANDKASLESAATVVENLWETFIDADENSAKIQASAFLRLAVEGMDEYDIWRATAVKSGMADISRKEVVKAWEEKTKEMGLEEPFELSKKELLSVIDDLTKGKELKVMNYLKRVADNDITAETDREIYLHAHETLFKGVSTEEEKWDMIATWKGIIDPNEFVIALKSEALYRNKDVEDLTKEEIMEMIKKGPIVFGVMEEVNEPEIVYFFRSFADALKGDKLFGPMVFSTEGVLELQQETSAEIAKIRGKMKKIEEKLRAKLKEMLEEIRAKREAKEEAQETSEQEGLQKETHESDQLASSVEVSNTSSHFDYRTNNDSLVIKSDGSLTVQEESSESNNDLTTMADALYKEYSRTTDYFETNGASLDPNWVDVTDEASSLLFIPPRTSASHYIDAVQ